MSFFANTLTVLIKDYLEVKNSSKDSKVRLLIPAPTAKIGIALQDNLFEKFPNIPSYLVVDSKIDKPDKAKGWLSAGGITSIRLDSFVLITQPGQYSYVEESVTGAINKSFSEGWPWLRKGESPSFSFRKKVLPARPPTKFP